MSRIRNRIRSTRLDSIIAMCFTLVITCCGMTLCADDGNDSKRLQDASSVPIVNQRRDWWHQDVTGSLLKMERWVTFDLETVLIDALQNSPLIQSVSHRSSIALERIVQQDAAFDPNVWFESELGRTNDPVGNSLTTGGPPRLVEESLAVRGGISRTNRRGTVIDLSQEAGLLDSNSNFFDPTDQGNSRLSLSLIQPLLSRGGQAYNERLLTQARIDSRVSWQQMRGDVEGHLADVINGYWRLYEIRCHFLQQVELLKQAHRIEEIIRVRRNFDAGALELAKVRQRVARRADGVLQLQAEVKRRQTQLARLVGAEDLIGSFGTLELIPRDSPTFPKIAFDLQDAVVQGLENRPDVRAAAHDLESSALSIQVTRAELLPQLTGVVDAYLLGLNGQNDVAQSFVDQFSRGGPGISASLRYELPAGRRAAKSRHREAFHRYRQRSEQLREVMQLTRAQIETAWISVNTSIAAQSTKQTLLETSLDEESILTRRWELMAGDGGSVGVVLENLLDSQQRRTDSERQWVTAQVDYMTSLVEIQRSMGTLLIRTGIQPHRYRGNKVRFQSTKIPDEGMLIADEIPDSNHDDAGNESFRMEDDLIEEQSTEAFGGFKFPGAPASFPPVVVPLGFEMPTAKKNAIN